MCIEHRSLLLDSFVVFKNYKKINLIDVAFMWLFPKNSCSKAASPRLPATLHRSGFKAQDQNLGRGMIAIYRSKH